MRIYYSGCGGGGGECYRSCEPEEVLPRGGVMLTYLSCGGKDRAQLKRLLRVGELRCESSTPDTVSRQTVSGTSKGS